MNQRIIDSVAAGEALNIPAEKAFVNIDKVPAWEHQCCVDSDRGLDEAVRAGRLKKGDVVIFVAFGAGLTWANAVVRDVTLP